MNKNKGGLSKREKLGWAALLATALLAVSLRARAETGSCSRAASGIKTLESDRVDSEAQYWSALMQQPGFAVKQDNLPGSDITDPALKRRFYSRLAFWLKQDAPPRPVLETLKQLNDVSQTISIVRGLCG